MESKLRDLEQRVGDLTSEIERSVRAERRLLQRLKDRRSDGIWKALRDCGQLPSQTTGRGRRHLTPPSLIDVSSGATVSSLGDKPMGSVQAGDGPKYGNAIPLRSKKFESFDRQLQDSNPGHHVSSSSSLDDKPWRLPMPKDLSSVTYRPKGLSKLMEREASVAAVAGTVSSTKRRTWNGKENDAKNFHVKKDPQQDLKEFLNAPSTVSTSKTSLLFRDRVGQRMKQSASSTAKILDGGDQGVPPCSRPHDPTRSKHLAKSTHSSRPAPNGTQWVPFEPFAPSSKPMAGSLSKMLASGPTPPRKTSNGATSTLAIADWEEIAESHPTQRPPQQERNPGGPFLTPPRRFNVVVPDQSPPHHHRPNIIDPQFRTSLLPKVSSSSSSSTEADPVSYSSFTTTTSTTLDSSVPPPASSANKHQSGNPSQSRDCCDEACNLGGLTPDVGCV